MTCGLGTPATTSIVRAQAVVANEDGVEAPTEDVDVERPAQPLGGADRECGVSRPRVARGTRGAPGRTRAPASASGSRAESARPRRRRGRPRRAAARAALADRRSRRRCARSSCFLRGSLGGEHLGDLARGTSPPARTWMLGDAFDPGPARRVLEQRARCRGRSGRRRSRASLTLTPNVAPSLASRPVASSEWPPRSKKLSCGTHAFGLQHRGERLGRAPVRRRCAGGDELAPGGRRRRSANRQRVAVDLAVGGEREGVEVHERRRDHVARAAVRCRWARRSAIVGGSAGSAAIR